MGDRLIRLGADGRVDFLDFVEVFGEEDVAGA
jgi:hypothetical protein